MTNEERFVEAFIQVKSMASDVIAIKGTMQQVADALTRLAIVEERQANTNASIGRVFSEIDKQGLRIGILEVAQPLQKQTTDWAGKAAWIVISAVIAALMSMVILDRWNFASRLITKTSLAEPASPRPSIALADQPNPNKEHA